MISDRFLLDSVSGVGVELTGTSTYLLCGSVVIVGETGVGVTCGRTPVGSSAIKRGRLPCVGAGTVVCFVWSNVLKAIIKSIITPPMMTPIMNKPVVLFFKAGNSVEPLML